MQNRKKKAFKKNLTLMQAVILIIAAVTAVFVLLNFKTVTGVIAWIFGIFSPFIIGLFIAFLVNILMVALEQRVFAWLTRFAFWNKIKRFVCMLLSFLLIVGIVILLCLLIVPQLQNSLATLSSNLPYYTRELQRTAEALMEKYNFSMRDLQHLQVDWQALISYASDLVAGLTPQVATVAAGITSGVFNFLMGIFFAIYMLFGKERILCSLKRTSLAYLGKKRTARICEVAALSHKVFKSFVVGQLTEALILGVLYFITGSIFRMPYALLLAVIMAIGGLIPMFGPIIAAVPCVFILLMTQPASALVFVIMSIVIQQVESNFIYPFIVGDSIGLPAIWVLLSILVGGSMFGALGMVLSVPIVSVLYTLLRQSVNARLPASPAPPPEPDEITAVVEEEESN